MKKCMYTLFQSKQADYSQCPENMLQKTVNGSFKRRLFFSLSSLLEHDAGERRHLYVYTYIHTLNPVSEIILLTTETQFMTMCPSLRPLLFQYLTLQHISLVFLPILSF